VAVYDFLRKVELFAGLSDDDLEKLCGVIDRVSLESGEELFAEGSTGDRAYVIKSGQLEILKASGGKAVLLAVRGSGDVIGEMSLLEEAPRMASVRARGKVELLAISQDHFDTLLSGSSTAVNALLHTVVGRWRATESRLRQSEKMAQLGTLTAGLAHELNNPAAAVARGASLLRDAETRAQRALLGMTAGGLSPEQQAYLDKLVEQLRAAGARPDTLDPVTRSDREEELGELLDDAGVDDAWDLAPALVAIGFQEPDLDGVREAFDEERFGIAVEWIGATYHLFALMEEVHQGAGRISEIVKALKQYSYLDQAPVQQVDVHEGLDNTLVILRAKLKQGVTVRREYAEELPKITAYGSELNQVWTNLIDNAVDAMEGEGELILRTLHEGDWIAVEIIDSGAGIPAEIQEKIFDAFFTTKPPGKGTGMGLDITWNIVVNKHKGELSVRSKPGRTCFRIRLPVDFDSIRPGDAEDSKRMSDEALKEILTTAKTVAVVGATDREGRPARTVPEYLRAHGYSTIPVNPRLPEVMGQKAYPDLASVPEPIDVVQVFRRAEAVPAIVRDAIAVGAKVVWMQEGIVHEQAADEAREAGLQVVMDRCMRAMHQRLMKS